MTKLDFDMHGPAPIYSLYLSIIDMTPHQQSVSIHY